MLSRQQLLLGFYLTTPIFLLVDELFGWNIRIASLENYPVWKIIYYLFCMCVAGLMWKWKSLEPILGIIEGGINMLLLTLSVMLPYYRAIEAIADGHAVATPLDGFKIINYIISGLFVLISMQLRNTSRQT